MAGINKAEAGKGRCRSTLAVLPLGELGEPRKVNLRDDQNPVFIRLADGSVQRLRSVKQIRDAERAGLGPVACASARPGGLGAFSFYPANRVARVFEGTAAHRAGMRTGDEIEAVSLIDPATGAPVAGEGGREVRVSSADMRGMRRLLVDNPRGVFDVVVRRAGGVVTLRVDSSGPDADPAEALAVRAAAESHDGWLRRTRSGGAGDGSGAEGGSSSVFVDTPWGRMDLNTPFAELPPDCARGMLEAGRLAAAAAERRFPSQQGQLLPLSASEQEEAIYAVAQFIYSRAVSDVGSESTSLGSADEDLQQMFLRMAERALLDREEVDLPHGINAPFGPAIPALESHRRADAFLRVGAGVRSVRPGSAAAEAGLSPEDRIVGVVGRPGIALSEIEGLLALGASEPVRLVVNRYRAEGMQATIETRVVEIQGLSQTGATSGQTDTPSGSSALGSFGVLLDAPEKLQELLRAHGPDAVLTPIPPEFRVLSPDLHSWSAGEIRSCRSGYSGQAGPLYEMGTTRTEVLIRTVGSHKDTYGAGAARVTAKAAPPMPYELALQAKELYGPWSRSVPVPVERFAPPGSSPIDVALARAGAPLALEVARDDLEGKVAAAVMLLATSGFDVAGHPDARRRAEYVRDCAGRARSGWQEQVDAGIAGGDSVYAGLVRGLQAEGADGVVEVARWLSSGMSEPAVAATQKAVETAQEVFYQPDVWAVDRTAAGTVTLARLDAGAERYDDVERVGHILGPAVVCSGGSAGRVTVSLAGAVDDGKVQAILADLDAAERAALPGGGRSGAGGVAPADGGTGAGPVFWRRASVQPGARGEGVVLAAAGSAALPLAAVAEVVDRHLDRPYRLPPLPDRESFSSVAAALGESEESAAAATAAASIAAAAAEVRATQARWVAALDRTGYTTPLMGAYRDLLCRLGLGERPGAGEGVPTILLAPDAHARASSRTPVSDALFATISDGRVVVAQSGRVVQPAGDGEEDCEYGSVRGRTRVSTAGLFVRKLPRSQRRPR